MTGETVVRLIVLLLAALATGGLMVNWIGLARAMERLSSAAYIEFHQATNRTFDPYMPIVVLGALFGGVALAAMAPGIHSASGRLAILGVLFYAAGLAISLSTNVPINKLVASWSLRNPPENWTTVRARWIRWHVARTLLSVPGLASYILSSLLAGR